MQPVEPGKGCADGCWLVPPGALHKVQVGKDGDRVWKVKVDGDPGLVQHAGYDPKNASRDKPGPKVPLAGRKANEDEGEEKVELHLHGDVPEPREVGDQVKGDVGAEEQLGYSGPALAGMRALSACKSLSKTPSMMLSCATLLTKLCIRRFLPSIILPGPLQ